MNWRRPLLQQLLRLAGRRVEHLLQELQASERLEPTLLEAKADDKLAAILAHSHANVPYYRTILEDAEAVSNGKVRLEKFADVPALTRESVRQEANRLLARDCQSRHPYRNSSGGSTGSPVQIVQDREYEDWVVACKYFFRGFHEIELGEPEIKIWGSVERTLGRRASLSDRLKCRLFNIEELNSFRITESTMLEIVGAWRRKCPTLVWGYPSSLCELALFVERGGSALPPPRATITTAEPLSEDQRSLLQEAFECPVFNQYGSREIGPAACECPYRNGLHTFVLQNRIEILDEEMKPCAPGQLGDVYVTTLNNWSMPLIRYQIGDTAIPSDGAPCPCGRTLPRIGVVAGRKSDNFKTIDGTVIHGGYFNQLVRQTPGIRQFQVIQRAIDRIDVYLVSDGDLPASRSSELEAGFQAVMGSECQIDLHFESTIDPTPSGKFRHTISEVW